MQRIVRNWFLAVAGMAFVFDWAYAVADNGMRTGQSAGSLSWFGLGQGPLAIWIGNHIVELAELMERHEKFIVAAGTLALALFTFTLWRATRGLQIAADRQEKVLQQSINVAARAADAAWLQAKAAIGVELPVLGALNCDLFSTQELIKPDGGAYGANKVESIPTKYTAVGPFEFVNMGRTPAFPIFLEVGYGVATILPDPPKYRHRVRASRAALIRPYSDASDKYRLQLQFGIEVSEDEIAAMTAGNTWLWVFGRLRYANFLGDIVDFKFCWRWSDQNIGQGQPLFEFVSDGHAPDSYTRDVEIAPIIGPTFLQRLRYRHPRSFFRKWPRP